MKKWIVLGLLALSLIGVPLKTHADPMSDGNTAYKAGDYNTAVADYKQAASQQTGVEQAKANYKLGLAYDKLGGHTADAEAAYQLAKTEDPTESFAKNPASFERKLARDGGGAATPLGLAAGSGASPAPASADPVISALVTSNVYIDPALGSAANPQVLQEAASNDDHTTVKIVLLDRLPDWAASQVGSGDSGPGVYAQKLYDQLNLGKNALIVVVVQGPGYGISDVSSRLTRDEETQLAKPYVAAIQSGDYNTAIPQFAAAVSGKIDAKERFWPDIAMVVFLILFVIVIFVLIRRSAEKRARMDAMRGPIEARLQDLMSNIEYIDGYAAVLPKNNADTDQVRAFRQSAAARVEQARKITTRATEISDLQRAQDILEKATLDAQQARRYLERATGGTSSIPGDDAVRPAPLPSNQEAVAAIPEDQRGVSFFSSRPLPVNQLVPVRITVDGQQRTVMASPAEAAEIQRGATPQVRSFDVGGQSVPWYAYQGYDPYRDYWNYQNRGWSNLGGNLLAGWIGAELFDAMLAPRYYGGWGSPYAFSPGWDSYGGWGSYDQGYYAGEAEQRMHDYAFNDPNPADNQGGGAGYDQSDYGAGGAGFIGGGGGDSS